MRGRPHARSEGEQSQESPPRTEPARSRLSIRARLIDMGHAVDERTASVVAARFEHGDPPTDAELQRALSDEQVREDLLRSFA